MFKQAVERSVGRSFLWTWSLDILSVGEDGGEIFFFCLIFLEIFVCAYFKAGVDLVCCFAFLMGFQLMHK